MIVCRLRWACDVPKAVKKVEGDVRCRFVGGKVGEVRIVISLVDWLNDHVNCGISKWEDWGETVA